MTSMIAVMKFQLLSVTVEVQIAQEWYIWWSSEPAYKGGR